MSILSQATVKTFIERLLLVAVIGSGVFVGAGLLGMGGAQLDSQAPPLLHAVPAAQQEDPHAGQVDHCTNAKTAPAAHKCECKKTADACDTEDKQCKVYCRKNHCHCFHPACDS